MAKPGSKVEFGGRTYTILWDSAEHREYSLVYENGHGNLVRASGYTAKPLATWADDDIPEDTLRELLGNDYRRAVIDGVPTKPAYEPIKIGDRVKITGDEYLIATPEGHKVVAVNVDSGERWRPAVAVRSVREITEDEARKLFGRYYTAHRLDGTPVLTA